MVSWFLLAFVVLPFADAQPLGTLAEHIHVDQFGYPPEARKVAVLADPQVGFNAGESYTPGGTLQLRRLGDEGDDAVVFEGAPVAWNGGATHDQSGDRVWWFDFSSVTAWGRYYVYDPTAQVHSPPFRIHPEVYQQALYDAARTFYYQRCNIAKVEPFAEANWTDGASHTADTAARSVYEPGNPASARDVSGGWYDAGDYNKYVNFTLSTLLQLIQAYRTNPGLWSNLDLNLPESANAIPDLLDEIRWELDWLLRLQRVDGGAPGKVAVTDFAGASPPSADTAPRYYGGDSTTAALTLAAVCAAAATAFRETGDAGATTFADQLVQAAERSWAWAEANPAVEFDNGPFDSQNPEDLQFGLDYGVLIRKLAAAVFLYEATDNAAYRAFVEGNYQDSHLVQWFFVYPFESAVQDALLHFTTLPGIDPTVRQTILDRKQASMGNDESLSSYTGQLDAYRAYLKTSDYTWGSNRTKADMALIYLWQNRLGLDPANAATYRDAAAGFLHYLHGTNPLGLTMLSNMRHAGVTRSIDEFYHGWFGDGTIWDNVNDSRGPPPGFVPGGPNPTYAPDADAYFGPPIDPPQNQPTQKAYRQWNTSFPENSWEITENGIYYQSAYILLASSFATYVEFDAWADNAGRPGADIDEDSDGDGKAALLEYVLGSDPTQPEGAALIGEVIGDSFELSFPLTARADTEIRVEATSDLEAGNWTPMVSKRRLAAWSESSVVEEDGGTVRVRFDNGPDIRHYRLRVTLIGTVEE